MNRDELIAMLAGRLNEAAVDPVCPMEAREVVRAFLKEEGRKLDEGSTSVVEAFLGFFWARPRERKVLKDSPPRFTEHIAGEGYPVEVWSMAVALSGRLTHPVLGAYLDDMILVNKEEKGPVGSLIGFDFRVHYQRTILRYLVKAKWLQGQAEVDAHRFNSLAFTDAIERAAELCTRYVEVESARELLTLILEEAAKQFELKAWRWLLPPVQAFTTLARCRKLKNVVPDRERHRFMEYAKACGEGFAEPGGLFHLIPEANGLAALLATQLGFAGADEQEARANLRQIEKVADDKAKESKLGGSALLDHALILAKQLRDDSEVKRLTLKQIRYRQEARVGGEMKESVHQLDVGAEYWESFLAPFDESKTPEEGLLLWIRHPAFVPDYFAMKSSQEEDGFRVSDLFATTVLGGIGLQVAAPGSERTSRDLRIALDVSRQAQLVAALLLGPTWDFLVEKKGLQSRHVKSRIANWKLLHESNREIVLCGVDRHFQGDYVSSIHILTPQFEALIRRAFLQAGSGESIETSYSKAEGVAQKERTFGSFLAKEEVSEALGDRLAMHFRFLFTSDPGERLLGLNLRNDVAHGLVSPGSLTQTTSCMVLHAVLLLTLLTQEETAS